MKSFLTLLAVALLVLCIPRPASAGDLAVRNISTPALQSDYPYQKGVTSVEVLDGLFVSWEFDPRRKPSYDYELTVLRLGYMLSDIKYSGWLRGNYEFLLEGFVGPFYQGQGTALGGFTLLGRYNFVREGNAFYTPYLQIGAGGLYNDAFHHREQIEIGSGPEFNLQFTTGITFHLAQHWGLDTEFGYRHISDAETSSRNGGVNSFGGLVGVTYFF